MTRRSAAALLIAVVLAIPAAPGSAHHLGFIVPPDDDVTLGYKRIRSVIKEGRFELAARECGATPLGRRLDEASRHAPPDVRNEVRAAIARRDAPGTELALARFFLVIVRGLVSEAVSRVQDAALTERVKADQALKLLAAGWRYYNLADYAIYQRDVKAALGVRLAFEDAEFALGGGKAKQARYDEGAARRTLEAFRGLVAKILEETAPGAPAGIKRR